MFNFIDSLVRKGRRLIVDKEDTMLVLEVLDGIHSKARFGICMSMEIGSCGWIKEPSKWYIMFNCSDRHWRTIIGNLQRENRKIILKTDNRYHLEKD